MLPPMQVLPPMQRRNFFSMEPHRSITVCIAADLGGFPAQAHKFLTGYAPIRSMARVGAAAGALLAIPAEQLKQGSQPRVNVPAGVAAGPTWPHTCDLLPTYCYDIYISKFCQLLS